MEDSQGEPNRKHRGKPMAIACRHIVRFIESSAGKPVGFHHAPSDRERFPDAWCTACDKALAAAGGEWTPKVLERMGLRTLCPCCYLFAQGMADPAVQYETIRLR
jgi:hypothetical protein